MMGPLNPFVEPKHVTDGSPCWCEPIIEHFEDGDVIIHRTYAEWLAMKADIEASDRIARTISGELIEGGTLLYGVQSWMAKMKGPDAPS